MGRDYPEPFTNVSTDGFNPRARMGRDMPGRDWGSIVILFQSTRPYGARPYLLTHHDVPYNKVSIHAPVWGATIHSCEMMIIAMFQSTRPYGARLSSKTVSMAYCRFQSTRPYGARHQAVSSGRQNCPVSIHAPVWGATWRCIEGRMIRRSFNPRARMGRDSAPDPSCPGKIGFNPRARMGRDCIVYKCFCLRIFYDPLRESNKYF